MAEWLRPKIEWESTDYFNASDYNRIVNNVLYLEELANHTIGVLNYRGMTEEKHNLDMLYAREMNAIEENIEKIDAFYKIDNKIVRYSDNGTFLTYAELNRLEALIYMLYVTMKSQLSFAKHLSFKLGSRNFAPKTTIEDYTEDLYRLAYILGQKGDIKE